MEPNTPAPSRLPSIRALLIAAWFVVWIILATVALSRTEGLFLLSGTGWLIVRSAAVVGLVMLIGFAIALRWPDQAKRCFPGWATPLSLGLYSLLVVVINRRALWDGIHGSGDHMVHLTLARLTEAMIYTQGQIRGWCSALGVGIPLNELYPPGGNLLFVGLNALTLGLVGDERVYTWVVTLAFLGYGFAMFIVARQAFGRVAGGLILLLLLMDGGDWYFTWKSIVDGGMWAIALGLGLSFLGMWLFASDTPMTKARWASLVLCIGASLLLHPFFLFLNAFWFLCVCGVYLATAWRKNTRLPIGEGGLRVLGFGIGYGLIAFWWAPFVAGRDWLFPYGYWGRVMPDTGRQLLEAELFSNTPALIVVLCVVAWLWGITRPVVYVRALAVFCFLNVMMGTETARNVLAYSAALSFYEDMQAERLVATGKIGSLILLAGWAGTILSRWCVSYAAMRRTVALRGWMWPQRRMDSRPLLSGILHDHARLVLAMILAVPLVLSSTNLLHAVWRWHIAPTDYLLFSVPMNPFDWNDAVEMREVFLDELQMQSDPAQLVSDPFPEQRALAVDGWKVTSLSGEMGLAVLSPQYIPAVVLGTRPLFENEWLLELANVGWIIQQKNNLRPDWNTWGASELVFENDSFQVWKREDRAHRGWFVSGDAGIERLEDADGAIRFQVSGTQPGDFVRFALSRYRKWNATLNGEPVEMLLPQQVGEQEEAWKLIGFPVQDGVIELRYENSLVDVASGWASLAVLLIFALLVAFWRKLGALQSGRLGLRGSRALRTVAMLPVAAMLVIPFVPIAPEYPVEFQSRLTYVGNSRDQVGELYGRPDGKNDLLFELDVLVDPTWGKLKEISLARTELDPGDAYLKWWSTRVDGQWHVGVLDARGRRIDAIHGTVRLSAGRRQNLVLFATNPYSITNPIPIPLRINCTLRFENGVEITLEAR